MEIAKLSALLKTQMHLLIDYFLDEGIAFNIRHTFGYNLYDEERDDQIEITVFKRQFYIGITNPKFYMVHCHLGKGNCLQEDRIEFKSFDEIFNWIAKFEYDG